MLTSRLLHEVDPISYVSVLIAALPYPVWPASLLSDHCMPIYEQYRKSLIPTASYNFALDKIYFKTAVTRDKVTVRDVLSKHHENYMSGFLWSMAVKYLLPDLEIQHRRNLYWQILDPKYREAMQSQFPAQTEVLKLMVARDTQDGYIPPFIDYTRSPISHLADEACRGS